MAVTYTFEFRREVVRIALSNGLPRERVAPGLGIGKSTLGHWVLRYQTTDLPVAPETQTDLARENERLRLENRILRDEREILKKLRSFSRAIRHEVCLHLRASWPLVHREFVSGFGCIDTRLSGGFPDLFVNANAPI